MSTPAEEPLRAESAVVATAPAPNSTGDTAPGTTLPDVLIANQLSPLQSDEAIMPSRNLETPPDAPAPVAYNLPMDMTKDVDDPEDQVEVKFNFDAESIVNVVQMFSLTLNFQYLIDPGVTGSVTMTIETTMTRKEAWELFEHILWISGAYASKQNGFINILPFAKMPQERRLFAKHDPVPNVHVEIVRLFNTTAADIANLIKPFMTQGSTASPITYLNSILIIEAPPNMDKLRELIAQLDVMGETSWPQISLECRYTPVDVVVDELAKILPTIGFPVTTSEKGDGHSIKLVGLERLQVLIAAAPTREVLAEIERWVAILDREDSIESERIFFYDVKYNKAEDLSEQIETFFQESSSTSTSRSTSSGRSRNRESTPTPGTTTGVEQQSQSQERNRAQRQARRGTTQRAGNSSDEPPATVFDIPVTILADGPHNRLVLRTTPRAYAMLEALLARLDSAPLQVLIQATIAEITLTKSTEFGFQYAAIHKFGDDAIRTVLNPGGVINNPLVDVGLGNVRSRTTGTGTSATTETRFPGSAAEVQTAGDIFAFVQAVVGKANTRVLNSPQIIAISDEEATINVGDSIPVASRTETGITTDTRNFTDVQYQDTGIILTVTPHITANKLVTLDIRQEVSNAVKTETSLINSPTIQTRVMETSMIVEDGKTILLGGMIRAKLVNNNRGIPILKDIPYLGKLFSSDISTNDRTELLLLITVHVIDLETNVDQLLRGYQESLESIREFDRQNEQPPEAMQKP